MSAPVARRNPVVRFVLIATIVLVAILLVPEMLKPGLNMADVLVWLSPMGVLWAGMGHLPEKKQEGQR